MEPQSYDAGESLDYLHYDQRKADMRAGQTPLHQDGITNDPVGAGPGDNRKIAGSPPPSQDEIDRMSRDSDQDYASQRQIERARGNQSWDVPQGDKAGRPTIAPHATDGDDINLEDLGRDASDLVDAGD